MESGDYRAPDSPLSNVSQIVSLRNRLIHNYDNVDDAIIWAVLKKHLAVLQQEVKAYLEE